MDILNFLVSHWDTIGLVISNIVALVLKSPLKRFQ